jgi:hypothetical protein
MGRLNTIIINNMDFRPQERERESERKSGGGEDVNLSGVWILNTWSEDVGFAIE